ncbi:hypothetical protein ACHAXT_007409 [Thalassiosira profunda]
MTTTTTKESAAASAATGTETPALPALYFANDAPAPPEAADEAAPSLQTLPSELLHGCLAKYADWGDLARLACVQSKWKNLVEDAADFGGRDATWELSMCLLHGDDKHGGGEASDEKEEEEKNNRGLQKNEALAIKYLDRISGVDAEESGARDMSESSSTEEPSAKSVLPGDWESADGAAAGEADEPALLQLADCYLNGTGVEKPCPTQALRYLQSAYHLTNSLQSAHKLAVLYEYPERSNNLVHIDVVAAFEWFKAAAEKGCVPSMAELALCYELGCGVDQNDEEALEWYTKAANAGCPASHYSVGEHFEEARGVRMDREEACIWFHRAAVLGDEDGVAGLRRLQEVARRVVPDAGSMLNA